MEVRKNNNQNLKCEYLYFSYVSYVIINLNFID